MANRYAGGDERRFEGEGAAEQKGHQVVAPPWGGVGHLGHQVPVAIDPVPGQVGSEIGARRDPGRFVPARLGDVEERAGFGVQFAEPAEIGGELDREDRQIGLGKPRCQSAGDPRDPPGANRGADVPGVAAGFVRQLQ